MSTELKIRAVRTTRRRTSPHAARILVVAVQQMVMLCGMGLICSGCAALVPPPAPPGAPAPPAPEPYSGPTCAKLLGVPDCIAAGQKCAELLCKCIQRQFPGPGTPPILGEVTLESSPAVKCAAEILAEEAKAPQKIDAIRYLGRMGCTKCYPCVEEGLLAALDDCTEEVRFEAAKALRRTATENCRCCRYTSCCSQKVFDKLNKVAFDARDDGCPVEPSARVRRMARQALEMCGGPISTPEEPAPEEGPTGVVPPGPLPPPEEPPAEAPPEQAPVAEAPTAAAPPASAAPAAMTNKSADAETPPAAATTKKPDVAEPTSISADAAASKRVATTNKRADEAVPTAESAGAAKSLPAASADKPPALRILSAPPVDDAIVITDRSAEATPSTR